MQTTDIPTPIDTAGRAPEGLPAKICSPPKRRADWVGKWVKTRCELRNGMMVIPAGTLAVVRYGHNKAELTSAPCSCCGVQLVISKVPWGDLEYIGENTQVRRQEGGESAQSPD